MQILFPLVFILYHCPFLYMADLFKDEIMRRLECSISSSDCNCPIHGEWSNWNRWCPCTGECGQVGLKYRNRECNNPAPVFGGEDCIGSSTMTIECRMPGCTSAEYKDITKCDPLRSGQLMLLERVHKKDPALEERCLIAECHYSLVKDILGNQADRYWNALHCVKHNNGCPVPGGWSQWGKWSECSADSGVGKRTRCRTCDSPIPTNYNLTCKGENCTTEICHGSRLKESKSGVWGFWSAWSKCSADCGQGLRRRIRFCVKERELTTPVHLEKVTTESARNLPWLKYKYCQNCRFKRNIEDHSYCLGPHTEIEPCYLKSCGVDGKWSEWESWSQCSAACGVGIQSRSRACSSPPPRDEGASCHGPYTWIRHCYLGPCRISFHEVASFSGGGAIYYDKVTRPTRLLHLFVKVKPLCMNGDIIFRTSSNYFLPELKSKARLALAAGYVVFTATIGDCHLMIVSHLPVKMRKWFSALIMLTALGGTMRLDDSENYYKAPFSCIPKIPNFDSEMIVGGNFTGQLQKLFVNFQHREMKLAPQSVSENKYIFPSSMSNIIYESSDCEEGRSLDALILVPCPISNHFSVELVVKTTSQDGLLMMIKHFYATKYLLLSFEPRRILLQLIVNDCVFECFQAIEAHVNQWTYIIVDYSQTQQNWGLAINGGTRKVIKSYDINMHISCTDYIMVGDIIQLINKSEDKNILFYYGINTRSISGILAYVEVNNITIDIESLPAIVERGNAPFSSEAVSYTNYYNEIELIEGQQLNLTCVYGFYKNRDKQAYSTVYNNENEPIWIKLDTPLIENEIVMNRIGIYYEIVDNGEVNVLTTLNYPSRESIEGFYSCWVPNPTLNSNIILTYGVTIIDIESEFSSFSTSILKITSRIYLIIYAITVLWILIELEETYRNQNGIFSNRSVMKQLHLVQVCEISHNRNLKFILGVQNKLMKRRWLIGKRINNNL